MRGSNTGVGAAEHEQQEEDETQKERTEKRARGSNSASSLLRPTLILSELTGFARLQSAASIGVWGMRSNLREMGFSQATVASFAGNQLFRA